MWWYVRGCVGLQEWLSFTGFMKVYWGMWCSKVINFFSSQHKMPRKKRISAAVFSGLFTKSGGSKREKNMRKSQL